MMDKSKNLILFIGECWMSVLYQTPLKILTLYSLFTLYRSILFLLLEEEYMRMFFTYQICCKHGLGGQL